MNFRRSRKIIMLLCIAAAAGCSREDDSAADHTTTRPANIPPITAEVVASAPAASQSAVTSQSAAPARTSLALTKVDGKEITLPRGLKYIDVKVGDGPIPHAGQLVRVHYTGWLTNGTMFDSSRTRGEPFPFALGTGAVIEGWDIGVATMKVGGQRRLIIPPELGYGASGQGAIPPNATLIFDVELLAVQ